MAVDNTPEPDQQTERPRSRRKWYMLALAVVFLLAAGAYAFYYITVARFYVTTEDAYVQGTRIQVAPQISGVVTTVAVHNTDFVHAGETLVRLDPTDARIALDHAKANLARTVRAVRQLYARVDQQKSIIQQRQSTLAQAKRDYERSKNLLDAHGISRRAFEHSRTAYREARAALAAAWDKLDALKARTAGTTLRNHPRVKQAEAELRQAYLDVQRTRIVAPVTGYIAQRSVRIGEHVNPSTPMLSIVPLEQIWVSANFKETELASIHIGQPVTLFSDVYGSDVEYHGHVVGINVGSGAAFSLLPPQNATGNWIKVVRRVPVRIALDAKGNHLDQYPLRIGLSMHVSIDTHETDGPRLAADAPDKPRYSTSIYQHRKTGVDKLIKKILKANGVKVTSGDKPS